VNPVPDPVVKKKTIIAKAMDKITNATSTITDQWRAWLARPKDTAPPTRRHTKQTRLWVERKTMNKAQDKGDFQNKRKRYDDEDTNTPHTNDSIKLVTWNVQTLDNKQHDVQQLIETHSPDVLTLTETKHYRSNTLKFLMPKHMKKQYSLYSTPNAKEAGVVVLIRKRLESKATELTYATHKTNGCNVRLKLNQHRTINITGIYHRPWEPQDDTIWEWVDNLHDGC